MIINSLKLKNLGPFFGEHNFQLKTNYQRPIVLFGALNGSGKTTIFDSIQLALFGKYIKAAGKFKGKYDTYLKSLINSNTKENDFSSVQLDFTLDEYSTKQIVTIKRQWNYTNKINETCEIFINGALNELYTENSFEYIQDIISPELSNLFFFDGEKIESLADPIKSKFIIAQGINDLLGVNVIDKLIKSLSLLERKKAVKLSAKQNEISLVEEQQKIEMISESIKKLTVKKSQTQSLIDEKELEILEHNKLIKSSGAELFKEREKFKADLELLLSKKENLINQVHELVSGDLPLLLVADDIKEIESDLSKESNYTPNMMIAIKEEVEKFSHHQDSTLAEHERKKLLSSFFKKLDSSNNENQHLLNNLVVPGNDYLKSVSDASRTLEDQIDKVNYKIDQGQQKLNAIPEDGKVKDLLDKEKKLSDEILSLKVKLNLYNTEEDELVKQNESTNKILDDKIHAISENESINYLDRKIIKTSTKSRETLKNYKTNLIHKHIKKINDQIGVCFEKIYRKSHASFSFSINPEDYSLSVVDQGEIKSIDELSAGERQLLAISILWALAIISGKKMPILVDTPLARLDSKHRKNLLEEYFPKCSDQMMIFSTDEEIDQRYYPLIRDKLSFEYLIDYDDETRQSSVSKGYFEEAINQ